VERLLDAPPSVVDAVVVYSRDEARQHGMRQRHRDSRLTFVLGDVCDGGRLDCAMAGVDVVVHAAALKHVSSCNADPTLATQINVGGTAAVCEAAGAAGARVVVVVSTDKACQPACAMGATKAIAERVAIACNGRFARTRFVAVRFGNVLGSRGSVVPLFLAQARRGGPLTVTSRGMSRFTATTDEAADLVFAAARDAAPGETWVPRLPAYIVGDLAEIIAGEYGVMVEETGPRAGEKQHEVMISNAELARTSERCGYQVIAPESTGVNACAAATRELPSSAVAMPRSELRLYLQRNNWIIPPAVSTRAATVAAVVDTSGMDCTTGTLPARLGP
jgi:UDP-glucose 4-epimerase